MPWEPLFRKRVNSTAGWLEFVNCVHACTLVCRARVHEHTPWPSPSHFSRCPGEPLQPLGGSRRMCYQPGGAKCYSPTQEMSDPGSNPGGVRFWVGLLADEGIAAAGYQFPQIPAHLVSDSTTKCEHMLKVSDFQNYRGHPRICWGMRGSFSSSIG